MVTLPDLTNRLHRVIIDQENMIMIVQEHGNNPAMREPLLTFISQLNDEIFSAYEDLQKYVDETAIADPLDRWIEIAPESLPENGVHVDVYLPDDDVVERAFYDTKEKEWFDASDADTTYIEGAISHWRKGSRPSIEKKGGA